MQMFVSRLLQRIFIQQSFLTVSSELQVFHMLFCEERRRKKEEENGAVSVRYPCESDRSVQNSMCSQ